MTFSKRVVKNNNFDVGQSLWKNLTCWFYYAVQISNCKMCD